MTSCHTENPVPMPAGALAEPSPRSRTATATLHYQGATACGVMGLTLARESDAGDPVTGAEQVLRLAQAEALIRAVEEWLHCAWDPAPASAATHAGIYRATVRDPALAPPGTQWHVPAVALLVPPPAALRAPSVVWPAIDADVVLAQVPDDALDRLEPGALLWLAPSFGPAWPVRLRDAAGQLPPCPARLDLAAQRLIVAAGDGARADGSAGEPDAAGAPASAPLEVRLECPVQVPLDHWLGWGRADAPFHWPVPQPWSARLMRGDESLGAGALMPLGQGCGLRLAQVTQPLADAVTA